MQFLTHTNFDFMKYRKVWALVSLALTVLAIVVVFVHGKLNVGIDFAGGTQVVVRLRERSEERRVGKECRSRWSPYH